jgi:hypothetical protein
MSEALRLAELLEKFIKEAALEQDGNTAKTAAELRRLHEANQEKGIRLSERMKELLKVEAQRDELLDALWVCMEHNLLHYGESHNTVIQARSAIAAATKE